MESIAIMGSGHGNGGLQTHYRELVEFLCDEGHRIFCVTVGERCDIGERLAPENKVYIPHGRTTAFGLVAKWIAFEKALKQVRLFEPNIFIGAASGKAYASMARRLGPKVFSFYHEVITPVQKGDPRALLLAASFGAIAVQSPCMRDDYIAKTRTQKPVAAVPCFSKEIRPRNLAKLPERGDPVRLVYVGRLAANKGLAAFLSVYADICEVQNLILSIYGDGPERVPLLSLIQSLGIEGRVRLHGTFEDGELEDIFTTNHCLVLPSVASEGLPLVLLEAMSCGLTWIASDVGAIRDVATGNCDVALVAPNADGVRSGLESHIARLRDQSICPARLQNEYLANFGNDAVRKTWIRLIQDPRTFFSSYK